MGLTTKSDYEDLSLKGREDIDLLAKGECIARAREQLFWAFYFSDWSTRIDGDLFYLLMHSSEHTIPVLKMTGQLTRIHPPLLKEKQAKRQHESKSAQDLVNEIISSIQYKS